jgi:hypothetical protein
MNALRTATARPWNSSLPKFTNDLIITTFARAGFSAIAPEPPTPTPVNA